jgi:hypothetical protein
MTRWLLVSIGKKNKIEGFGGIQTHTDRERERGTDLRKQGEKGELREEMTGNGLCRLLSSGIFGSSSQPQV